MASDVTTAPEGLETGDGEAEAAPASSSRFGRIIGFFKGMSRKQMLIYGGAALLVVGLGYGGLSYFGGGGKDGAAGPEVFYHDLPEMLVNLSASQERPQYLRVRVTLEIDDDSALRALEPALPRVLDTFQVHLRELRSVDLDGSAGLFRLREELTRRVNHVLAPSRVRAVLFRELVVQ